MSVLLSPLPVCMLLCALIFGLFDSVGYVDCLYDDFSYVNQTGTHRQQALHDYPRCTDINGDQEADSDEDLHLHLSSFMKGGGINGTGKGMGKGQGERGTAFKIFRNKKASNKPAPPF